MFLFGLCVFLPILSANILNSAGQTTCLSEHNRFRTELAKGNVMSASGKFPPASNMNKLLYSKDLEAKAQSWAKQCPGMKHTPNPTYGQNLYWTSATVDQSTALKQATKAWWDESRVARIQHGDVTLTMQLFNQGVGHFTQMAQATAKYVGCSVEHCSGTYVVCNYDRQNVLNQAIYAKGTACKQCTSCEGSLCKTR